MKLSRLAAGCAVACMTIGGATDVPRLQLLGNAVDNPSNRSIRGRYWRFP